MEPAYGIRYLVEPVGSLEEQLNTGTTPYVLDWVTFLSKSQITFAMNGLLRRQGLIIRIVGPTDPKGNAEFVRVRVVPRSTSKIEVAVYNEFLFDPNAYTLYEVPQINFLTARVTIIDSSILDKELALAFFNRELLRGLGHVERLVEDLEPVDIVPSLSLHDCCAREVAYVTDIVQSGEELLERIEHIAAVHNVPSRKEPLIE